MDVISVGLLLDGLSDSEKRHFQVSNPALGKKFLLVYQSAEMRRMLALYGQALVCLDATYKTCLWGFPLFILSVITNHGNGYPVAVFFLESESTVQIAEALEWWVPNILRFWS